MNFFLGGFLYLISWILFVQWIVSDVKFKLRNWKLKVYDYKTQPMSTTISFPGVPGDNCSCKAASHVCRAARPACLLPQTHTVYSIHRIEKLRRICSREESAGMEIFCRAPTLNRGTGDELPAICRPSPPLDKHSAMESNVFLFCELRNLCFIQIIRYGRIKQLFHC